MPTIPDSCPTLQVIEPVTEPTVQEVSVREASPASESKLATARSLAADTIPAPPLRDTTIDDLAPAECDDDKTLVSDPDLES